LATLGHPSKFQWFRVLPSLLQRRRSPEANQTLRDVWPSPWLLHYIYIFGSCCPLTEFCPVQNSLYAQVLRSRILAALLHCTTLQQRASVKLCGVVQGMELPNFCRGRHLYSAGRPSRWASAYILVLFSSPIFSIGRLDVYRTSTRTSTRDVALVRIEMCCTRLAGNTGRKNDAKNRHLRTMAQLCRAISSQLRQCRQSEKTC